MPMITTLYSILAGARKHGKAAAQFNVWNCEMLFGVLDAVERLQIPAILATGTAFLPMRDRLTSGDTAWRETFMGLRW